MFWPRVALSLMLLCVFTVGCASTTVTKNPTCDDDGIRFYRPKPYLMIKPGATAGTVDISTTQLPDYNEEYSIHICAGLGTNNTQVTLDDGWNLTGLNVDVDSKATELIGAATNAATSLAGLADKGNGSAITVSAKDVPMGLYEAVIGQDDCGRKHLYGWRYVGFMPYTQCPTYATGGPFQQDCQSGLWGLLWKNDTLTFMKISDIEVSSFTPPAPSGANAAEEVSAGE